MSLGVTARDLSDEDLRRELAQLKEKAADIDSDGTSHQQANHRARTDELEAEFVRRFAPEPDQPAEPDHPAEPDQAAEPADAPTDDPDRPANPA